MRWRASPRFPMKLSLTLQVFAVVIQLSAAGAQTTGPSTDPASTPNLQLNSAQKQTIYTSIRNLNVKNEAPPNFQPIVGAVVPAGVNLEPVPQTVAELAPQVKGFQLGLISNQVVVVDPKARRVVEVIAGEH
jgi:hypothetical protein